MLNKILLFSLLISVTALRAQTDKILFEYDAAGNQISRELCINCSTSRTAAPGEIPEPEPFFPQHVISYYPNPVKETLYLNWQLPAGNTVKHIELYSQTGQLLWQRKDMAGNATEIDFRSYAQGLYLLYLNCADGDVKSIKILKK